ncbi:MAG TPA: hypothetical protein VG650_16390 [Mycobacteriales bacterium]|nr:hypothetical protein [Mycobacteriales bacterium]
MVNGQNPPDAAWSEKQMADALVELCAQFPWVPRDVVASVLGDSYRTVVEARGVAMVGKAEELTRIRLEVRTHHPALPLTR